MSIHLWIGVAILIFCLVIGIPVAFSFASASFYLIVTLKINPQFLMPYGYSKVTAITLLCMPMFIIAGNIMKDGKIGDALIGFVEHFALGAEVAPLDAAVPDERAVGIDPEILVLIGD